MAAFQISMLIIIAGTWRTWRSAQLTMKLQSFSRTALKPPLETLGPGWTGMQKWRDESVQARAGVGARKDSGLQ